MEDLNTLYYFTQVVEHRGFAAAGRALDMPKSKLSRRISELEERLGVRLINRTSRHCSLTEIGQAYYQRCLAMRVEAESAAEVIELNRSEPQGIVRLSCPTALLNSWVGPMLTRYMLQYPLVELHVESTNRRVDVIYEGFDIALRIRFPPLENTDLVMKVLGNSTQCLVGSPQFCHSCRPRLRRRTSMVCRACIGDRRTGNISGNCLVRTVPARSSGIIRGWSPMTCWRCGMRPVPEWVSRTCPV